jgi:hypothetical protein
MQPSIHFWLLLNVMFGPRCRYHNVVVGAIIFIKQQRPLTACGGCVSKKTDKIVEGEKTGDGTNSNKCTGPRKLLSHKRFLNIDARPIASFAFLPGALCFFI